MRRFTRRGLPRPFKQTFTIFFTTYFESWYQVFEELWAKFLWDSLKFIYCNATVFQSIYLITVDAMLYWHEFL